MKYRKLGLQGPEVSAIGLGCMGLGIAHTYTSSAPDAEAAVQLIHRALDSGITLLDTADIYGDSERQVGKALKGRREEAVLATKFGFVSAIGSTERRIDGSPAYVRQACEASLQRLGVEQIDLYYLHRVDAHVPIEETVGAMAQLVRQGKVKHIGLSEAAPATVRRAHDIHPIAAVQSEYSLWSRDPEDELLETLDELGIALVAYSPLGRGFLGGRFHTIDDLAPDDWRRRNPRFQGENFARNVALVAHLRELAAQKQCTPAQLAIAWLLAQNDRVIPIPGTTSAQRLAENVAAVEIRLSEADLESIEQISPQGAAAGGRYDAVMLGLVNR